MTDKKVQLDKSFFVASLGYTQILIAKVQAVKETPKMYISSGNYDLIAGDIFIVRDTYNKDDVFDTLDQAIDYLWQQSLDRIDACHKAIARIEDLQRQIKRAQTEIEHASS